jgi:hypothetical protein
MEQPDRVVTSLAPKRLVQRAEEIARLGVPGPPEILSQLGEPFQ